MLTEWNTEWDAEFCADDASSNSRNLYDFAPPASRIFLQTHILPTLLQDGVIKEIYINLLNKNGSEVPVLLNARTDDSSGHSKFIWSIFRTQQRRKFEGELLRRKQVAEEMTVELERVANELKRSNEALVSFTNVVTHDLKAPARHVRLSAELLEMELEGKLTNEVSELLNMLKDGATNMTRIIDDLHRYSLVGTNHGDFGTLIVESFLKDVFRSIVPDQSLKFIYEGTITHLETLKVPFELVVRNLIDNAVKHHHANEGIITASIVDEGDNYRIDIADDGPGIDPDFHDVIFGEFSRLSSSKVEQGSGLGLAMVKRTVENYGGRISVESNLDAGSRFSVYWPKEQALKRILQQ